MVIEKIKPSGQERFFDREEIIVSKTDRKGLITYANAVFCRVSQFTEQELLGQPHNLVRHPDMPRGVFRFLWERLKQGREVFALVVNLARDGAHYWVLAHITPSYSLSGELVGYHSNRRRPEHDLVKAVEPLYRELLELEKSIGNPKQAAEVSQAHLEKVCGDYDPFLFSLLEKRGMLV